MTQVIQFSADALVCNNESMLFLNAALFTAWEAIDAIGSLYQYL